MSSSAAQRPRRLLWAYCALVGILMALPVLIVIPVSFTSVQSLSFPPPGFSTRWYERFFTEPEWQQATSTSIRVGLVVAVLATALGTMAALGLTTSKGRLIGAARAFLIAPMVIPGVIVAIGIYYVFLKWHLSQTFVGFVLAHTVLAVPIVVITVSASLQSFDFGLVRASASLGAGPFATFRSVTLPLIAPGVLTGALFAFLTSFDESIVSLFLSGPDIRTLPIQIYVSVTSDLEPTVAAASSLLILFTTVLMALFGIISHYRTKAGSRG